MLDLHEMSLRAREASYDLSVSSPEQRNRAILNLSGILKSRFEEIRNANRSDYTAAETENLSRPLLHRLIFDEKKLQQTTDGLTALAQLPDPLGATTYAMEITAGMKLYRVVCPIGIIGVIFESRPDALIQIASLCIKSGNTVLLKGGREASLTNHILCDCVRQALRESGLSEDAAQLLETREDVSAMLKEDGLIDLIIPRGSRQFTAEFRSSVIPMACAMFILTSLPIRRKRLKFPLTARRRMFLSAMRRKRSLFIRILRKRCFRPSLKR